MKNKWPSMSIVDEQTVSVPPYYASLRALYSGLIGVFLFCVIAIALRGVRWDETYEWAQILNDRVTYPVGHPFYRYVRGMFTVQGYLSSFILSLTGSEKVLSAFRNLLFMMSGLLPVFLFGRFLSQKSLGGIFASFLALQGMLAGFGESYPLRFWPHSFSCGPIGSGFVLLTLFLIIAGYTRTGYFMIGLMPAIHVGQVPVLYAFGLIHVVYFTRKGGVKWISNTAPFFAFGVFISIAVLASKFALNIPAPISGPFFSDADPYVIWRNVKELFSHTSLRGEFLYSHMALAGSMLLALPAARAEWKQQNCAGPWCWLLLFICGTAVTVWSARILHGVMGLEAPFLLLAWMPYRLTNHVSVLLLVMLVGIMLKPERDATFLSPSGYIALIAVVVFYLINPTLERHFDGVLFQRYFADGTFLLFLLYGGALSTLAWRLRDDRIFLQVWLLAVVVALFLLFWLHQFAVVCCIFAFICGLFARYWETRQRIPAHDWLIVVTAFALSASAFADILLKEWNNRVLHKGLPGYEVPLAYSDFDRAVNLYLSENNHSGALIVADNYAAFLQARIGHPVMAHWMSASYAANYMPEIAPSTQKIFLEIYGIDYGKTSQDRHENQPTTWQTLWGKRTVDDWRILGDEYGFRYIIIPNHLNSPLRCVVPGAVESLYEIPEGRR